MLLADRIEIHQSQPDSMTKRRLEGHTSGCDWWIFDLNGLNLFSVFSVQKQLKRRFEEILSMRFGL